MYSVKAVKSFIGNEGHGFNASLYRKVKGKDKKVAFVIDDASGGQVDFQWLDFKAPRVDINVHNYQDEPHTYRGTPEQKLFVELADSQTYTVEWDDKTHRKNGDILAGDLVNEFLVRKDFKRICRTKTAFKLKSDDEGQYFTIKASFTPELAAELRARHGDNLEVIYNEKYAA